MIKATLTKLSDNKNALRTNSMEGAFISPPEINKQFIIFGEALEVGNGRAIITSLVKNIERVNDKTVHIRTINSNYSIALNDGSWFVDNDGTVKVEYEQ